MEIFSGIQYSFEQFSLKPEKKRKSTIFLMGKNSYIPQQPNCGQVGDEVWAFAGECHSWPFNGQLCCNAQLAVETSLILKNV